MGSARAESFFAFSVKLPSILTVMDFSNDMGRLALFPDEMIG
jgi:hypothetical protein